MDNSHLQGFVTFVEKSEKLSKSLEELDKQQSQAEKQKRLVDRALRLEGVPFADEIANLNVEQMSPEQRRSWRLSKLVAMLEARSMQVELSEKGNKLNNKEKEALAQANNDYEGAYQECFNFEAALKTLEAKSKAKPKATKPK